MICQLDNGEQWYTCTVYPLRTPYGEMIANQRPMNYDERYKFTGKERDAESGYDYFGARYYASPLYHWTKVDPLADKYPNISPYAYAAWNPVKYVDPDGREIINKGGIVIFDDKKEPKK